MWLEPNDWYAEPDRYDRSGMWINLADNGFEVIDVVAGGPAAQAGLTGGDVITEIDGQPAGEWKLYGLRQFLREEQPGKEIAVRYRRGDAGHETRIVLRELVP
jgi:C-terminal processing protease CtpA/Prc